MPINNLVYTKSSFRTQDIKMFAPKSHICPHMQENGLIKKLGLISKFVLSHTGKQIITIHILPNIPIIKGHQTMKVGLVIECIMRNIFCEKLYAKCGEEGIFRAFYKNLN